ncbi:MAG: glyoxalase [Candidatus Eremiobacteraeota bacterium]|nr:glyoxalase [Candidatus Eremiobacteraeota bacterium]
MMDSGEPFCAIDHIQLAMPVGGEAMARAFYVEVLGMVETPKPEELVERGGCWFRSGTINIHLGVESTEFKPARKAHPGLICSDFDALMAALQDAGVKINFNEALDRRRAFVDDAFGNRIELLEKIA